MTYTYNPKKEDPSYITAIQALRPNLVEKDIQFHINGQGDIIFWEDYYNEPPKREEVLEELAKQAKEYAEYSFYRLRKQDLPEPYDLIWKLYDDIKCGNIENGSFVSLLDSVVKKYPNII